MGLFFQDAPGQFALLACDRCDRMLAPHGGMSDMRKSDTDAEQLGTYFRLRNDLARVAFDTGWHAHSARGETRVHWTCPECLAALAQPA